jgi:hypothetical protein
MDWKAQLEGEESALTQLRTANNVANASITRNGIEWFLESGDFELLTDDLQVRERAQQILTAMMAAVSQSANIGIGSVFRMHYDGSKTVFRAPA